MESARLPSSEVARQRDLDELDLVDTPAEEEFDDITRLASFICQVPIALISLIDHDRQWFKSHTGLDVRETSRDIALCAHAILDDDIFEVPDASLDPRFADNPVVTGEPNLRFYAGVPLKTADDHNIGTLCVIDHKPGKLSQAQRSALRALGRQVIRLAELRKATRDQGDLRRELIAGTALNRAIIDYAGTAIISTDLDGTIQTFNPAAEELLGYTAADMNGLNSPGIFHVPKEVAERAEQLSQEYGEKVEGFQTFVRPLRDKPSHTEEWLYVRKDGTRFPVSLTVSTLRNEMGEPFGYLGVPRDLTERKRQDQQREAEAKISDIRRRSQEAFIAHLAPSELFDRLLLDTLDFTGSEYGFIGEILHDAKNEPYLKTHAITNISWNEATRKLYEDSKATGFLFRNLKTLFGSAITTGQPVIANSPSVDPRRGGLPEGHPEMRSFLGLPLYYGDQMVGLIGLANRPGGYDMDLVRLLSPLSLASAALIYAMRLDAERTASNQSLSQQEARFQLIVETAAEAFIEVSQQGLITQWNRRAVGELQVPLAEALGQPVDKFFNLRGVDGPIQGLMDCAPPAEERLRPPQEYTVVRRDGSEFQGELVLWTVPTSSGRRLCAFLRNVTERHELEEQQRLRFQSDTLLKEIHHRVKNNMQVISSLLSIQSGKLKDKDQRDVFLACRERIRAMSLIHDRLYSTGSYEQIDFGDYLREMVALIISSNGQDDAQVHTDITVEHLEVSVEKAVPLSLIASELVLNSLKHAFRGRAEGNLTVRLSKEGSSCRLFIGDDGPGMPLPDPAHRGVGLQLIEGLSRQIKARRQVDSSPDGGGTHIIWEE